MAENIMQWLFTPYGLGGLVFFILLLLWWAWPRRHEHQSAHKDVISVDAVASMSGILAVNQQIRALRGQVFEGMDVGFKQDPDALEEALRTGERIQQQMQRDIDNNTLELPSLPENLVRIRSLADDDEASAQQLVQALQTDPAISARIMKLANSAAYGTQETHQLQDAVVRLGKRSISDLLASLMVRELMQTRSTRELDPFLKTLWAGSVQTSAIAMQLARQVDGVNAAEAMLAGLVHDIGSLVVLTYVNDTNATLLKYPDALNELLQSQGPSVGRRVLEHWGYPRVLSEAAAYDDMPSGVPSKQPLLQVLLLSKCLSGNEQDVAACQDMLTFFHFPMTVDRLGEWLQETAAEQVSHTQALLD